VRRWEAGASSPRRGSIRLLAEALNLDVSDVCAWWALPQPGGQQSASPNVVELRPGAAQPLIPEETRIRFISHLVDALAVPGQITKEWLTAAEATAGVLGVNWKPSRDLEFGP